jgi:Sulfotransferase family
MASTAPIYIMSSERTGSNLLRTLLSNHSAIGAPTAPQLLNSFRHGIELYKPLSEPANAVAFSSALVAIANHAQHDWQLELDVPEFVKRERPVDFLDLFDALYRAKLEQMGGRRYVCKENRLFDFIDGLLQRHGTARVIYLVRDPRDYAVSWMRVPFQNDTPHQAAVCWRDEQRLCLAAERRHGERVLRLTYEDLIEDPQAAMARVLEHLDEPLEPACFEVQGEKNRGQAWSSFWRNLTQPVKKDNRAKYRQAFTPRTLEQIETVCAAEMDALGYAAETPRRWKPGPLFAWRDRRLAKRNDRRLRAEHADTVAVISDRRRLLDGLLAERRRAVGM